MTMSVQNRRTMLAGIGALGLAGCAPKLTGQPALQGFGKPVLPPIDVRMARITNISVCLRPFRAAGPRMDVETVGGKRVVHNYGHGGSGWSLSWGSAAIAAAKAMEGGTRDVAVIGCGAIGLTSAITLQRAGARVTIYAKERLPQTRSARATGTWSPASRIADVARMGAGFPALWEQMARASWAAHLGYVGMAGEPVLWSDLYILHDADRSLPSPPPAGAIDFAHFPGRLRDLTPRSRPLTAQDHPFPVAEARLAPSLTFNIAELGRRLMADFLMEGGRIEPMVFHTPADLARLRQPVVVNCTGYGARDLWADDSIIPVRGQIAWLPAQPELRYSIFYRNISLLPRPDGIVLQQAGPSEMFGYGIADETPDRAEAEAAAAAIAPLFAGRAPARAG
ncbi:FAD-dependent oxidoreductase [Sandaracinobacter sp.]|uniref:FAD-dependent oxidoreductase n=1 Tax=Sandaracinobacter sp. TaxID=2487581 RepID=UPI0035B2A082